MRNPDSLNVGEPGRKENLEHQHPNRPSLHRASDLDRDRAWWRAEARRVGSDWLAMIDLHLAIIAPLAAAPHFSQACDACGAAPCINPSFCGQCRKADARLRAERRDRSAESIPQGLERMSIDVLWHALNYEQQRSAPQSTIEAIMYCVRERGLAALKEPNNQERLSRCDAAARQQINQRIERLKKTQGSCCD
jgi:hypothetical protein